MEIGLSALVLCGTADAQSTLTSQSTEGATQRVIRPAWDVAVTAGFFQANPRQNDERYGDDWYFEGRYAVSIGRFWTEHLKTEVEFATTGEGIELPAALSRPFRACRRTTPYSVQEHFQLESVLGPGGLAVLENGWVHPYVCGGVVVRARAPARPDPGAVLLRERSAQSRDPDRPDRRTSASDPTWNIAPA